MYSTHLQAITAVPNCSKTSKGTIICSFAWVLLYTNRASSSTALVFVGS